MPWCRAISALFCGVSLGLLFFAGPDAAARVTSLAPTSWTPPTPAEGTRLQTAPGDPLRFNLAALAQDAPGATITIGAAGVPPGATFRTTPGNPAAAGFIWVPRPTQAGRTYSLTFTAQPDDQAVPPRTRRVDVHVVARKATRFALSSGATATYRWAFVIRRVVARSAPSRTAAPVARLRLLTPENTTNLVQAIEGRRTARGVWVRVRLPILPNNSTGWVPRRTLGNWRTVRTHLLVDRRRLTLTLYRAGKTGVLGEGRRRPAAVTDARRPVLRAEHAVRVRRPGVRPGGVRDERALARADRLARGEASSGSMGRTSRGSCRAASPTDASASGTPTCSGSRGSCRSGPR